MKVSREDHESVPSIVAARQLFQPVLCLFVMFGSFPAIIKKFWLPFLPSPQWISVSNQAGWISGLVTAALFFILVMISVIYDGSISDGKKIVAVIFSPILGFLLGMGAVLVSVPMTFALAFGHHVVIGFTVETSAGSSGSYCSSPVKLKDLPFLFNEVCDVPDAVRHGLTLGSHVVVMGWGNTYGVFPQSLRPTTSLPAQ